MSRQGQIFLITPFFLFFAALSCIFFSKLNHDHHTQIGQKKNHLEEITLKRLEEPLKEAMRENIHMLAYSSAFRLAWSSKFVENINSIADYKVGGFELLLFLLTDEEVCESLLLVNNHNKQCKQLLNILKEALVREYESLCFFDRARQFASCLGLKEDLVLKVLKEGIERVKYEKDPSSILIMIDYLNTKRGPVATASFSLL